MLVELTWYAGSYVDLPDVLGDSSDIYFTDRNSLGAWSQPVNLGSTINTAGGYETDSISGHNGSYDQDFNGLVT